VNRLYFGDNLKWLSDRKEFPDANIDLVYLDPPFNSNSDYNVLFREPSGQVSQAQFHAFTDTWSWADDADTYHQFINNCPNVAVVELMEALEHAGHLTFNKKNDIESELFLSRKTLGALITELKRLGLDDETADMLKDALEARNFLMHHFFVCHARDYGTPEGRAVMLKELQKLRFRIGRVQHVFSQLREHYVEQVYGVTQEQLKQFHDEYMRNQGHA